jgi:Cu2+-exporting ATPase
MMESNQTEGEKKEKKGKETKLRIGGMHCASCVNTVSGALKNVKGVSEAEVNLATSSAKVIMDVNVRLKEVVRAVRKAGYDVVTSRATLKVNVLPEDMSKVRTFVESLPGVIQALDNPGLGTINVEFNPEETSATEIAEKLTSSGYSAKVIESGKEEDVARKDFIDREIRLIVGIVLLPFILLTHGVLQLILSIPVQFFSGSTFHKGFIRATLNKNANMDTLISLASNILWFSSLYFLALGKTTFFDVSSMLITFVLIGKTLESYLKYKISTQVKVPEMIAIKKDGSKVNAKELKSGDMVVIKSGENIPADGIVEEGQGLVDESIVTGESQPVLKTKGDRLLTGSMMVSGYIEEYVTTPFERTYINSVVQTLREAYNARVSMQRIADKASAIFTPIILAISGITFGIWFAITGNAVAAMLFGVSVLAAACPCALGLATPMAILVKVNRAVRKGIIIKNGSSLENITKVNAVILDKTGTVTSGTYRIENVKEFIKDAFSMASALEKRSSHPIAKAFPPSNLEVTSFEEFIGNGIYGVVNGHDVIVGKPNFVKSNCNWDKDEGDLMVCIDGNAGASITLKEEIRNGVKELVNYLKGRGIKVIIATGDESKSSDQVASYLGVELHKGMSPDDKGELTSKLKESYKVLFVGDGVNDALAMKEADVGVAVSSGSDVAKAAGEVVIRDLGQLSELFKLGESTEAKVKQNLAWAFGYNALMVPLASGIFYPLLWLPPEFAALAMSFSSVIVSTWSLL